MSQPPGPEQPQRPAAPEPNPPFVGPAQIHASYPWHQGQAQPTPFNAPQQYPASPHRSSRRLVSLIIGVICLVLLLGGGILAWLLIRDNDEGTQESVHDSGSASETVEQYFKAIMAQDKKTLAELSCKKDRAEFIDNGSWKQAYESVEEFSVEVKNETKEDDYWAVDFSYSATIEGVETEGNQSVQVVKEMGAYKVCVSQTLGLLTS